MTETDLYEQIALYLNVQYPGVIYHFDLSGLWTPSHKLRNLYGRLNKRAWPDLFVAGINRHGMMLKGGLFIELKREGTNLKLTRNATKPRSGEFELRKKGDWADSHVEEQAAVLAALRGLGYKAEFGVGFSEAKKLIDDYLRHL